jgi:hypothetical protein
VAAVTELAEVVEATNKKSDEANKFTWRLQRRHHKRSERSFPPFFREKSPHFSV